MEISSETTGSHKMGNGHSRDEQPRTDAIHRGGPPETVRFETKDEPKTTPVTKSVNGAKNGQLPTESENFEVVACKTDEMKIGEMRHVAVPGAKQQLLVGKGYDGQHFAMTSACTHYNAFLKNGVLSNGRIRCPWHGACFSTKTGDIEEFPCNDGVHIFQVNTVGNDVVVKGSAKNVDDQKRAFPMAKWNRDPDGKRVVIIGGGPAALICAETLRKEQFQGQIIMLTEEPSIPYDRPKLSKTLDASIEKIQLRKDDFLARYDIDVRRNAKVTSIDTANKFVSSTDDSIEGMKYDYLVIATGQHVRTLPITETKVDWKNIHYLRTIQDANAIGEAGKKKHVVILGSSFIGMECAAYFSDKATSVTVISRTRVPFQHAFGPEVGEVIKTELFDKKGVKFLSSIEGIEEYIGDEHERQLQHLKLSDGTKLDLDILIVGIGTIPNTDFLADSGLELNPRSRSLKVDEFMATNIPDVYGAGDVVEFPLKVFSSVRATIGHWNIAHSLGRTAALSIVGNKTPIHTVPYFWTQVFGKSVRYAGYGYRFDDIFIHGTLAGMKFVAYYLKGGEVVAAASLMYDPVVSRFAELVSHGKKITKSIIEDDPELTKLVDATFTAAA
ncbi:apoptosis-inducing factor 3-like isoform X3 [Paramacrobiotus metropolitanus]|uniref:apoptosis-inducing factor 3-like isoform X2 n=1 Tax=Paramacrobiotus metropolitanus TaxID=2943436 RepID=UPI0024458A97|nr:apoptosis-inducing factor 3-like isoform X2 [Paramacrobiotus metropolitanus]XP_055331411.1 apoptosis-inducing factor 3-like isoform X3 [Paramacrobiotus metropolitanus]